MSVEWQIIFTMFVFICAYFSYKTGFERGVTEAVGMTLDNLEQRGLILIEEDGTISPTNAKK
jgi:hypothetical protein